MCVYWLTHFFLFLNIRNNFFSKKKKIQKQKLLKRNRI